MLFGWLVDEPAATAIIRRAVDLGVNFFDTANIYAGGRSEEILGAALKERREDVVIATKVFWSLRPSATAGLARSFVFKELNDSLRRLQTDYVDVYYIHRFDAGASLENVLRTLNIAMHDGRVHHIGASTMHAWEFMKSLWVADTLGLEPFQVMQPHYNLLYREEEREMLPLCQDQRIAVAPWGPLARGVLAGGYTRDQKPDTRRAKDPELANWFLRPPDFVIVDRVVELAKTKGASPAQIALAWLFAKPEVSAPVVGVTQVRQLEEAVEALDITLSAEEVAYLEELYQPRALTGHYAGRPMPGDLPA